VGGTTKWHVFYTGVTRLTLFVCQIPVPYSLTAEASSLLHVTAGETDKDSPSARGTNPQRKVADRALYDVLGSSY